MTGMRFGGMVLAVALTAGGCVTRPLNLDPKATIDPAAKGLLVVAVDSQVSPEDLGKVGVSFYVRAEGQAMRYPDVFNAGGARVVWALPLPPGDYSVSDWYQSASVANRVRATPKYRFAIVAGEATYIGTFEVMLERRDNLLGMRVVPWSSVRVRDRRARDIAQFNAQFPAYKDWPMRHEVVDGFAWSTATRLPDSVQQMPVK